MRSPWWVSTGSTNWQKNFFPACLSVPPTSGLKYQSSFCTIRYSKAVYQMVKLATVSTALQTHHIWLILPGQLEMFVILFWHSCFNVKFLNKLKTSLKLCSCILQCYDFPNFIHFSLGPFRMPTRTKSKLNKDYFLWSYVFLVSQAILFKSWYMGINPVSVLQYSISEDSKKHQYWSIHVHGQSW
jgi:hypothetical protein